MSTMGKDLLRGCGRSAVIQVIAWVIGIPIACLMIGAIVWVVNTFYDNPLVIALAVAIPLILISGGSIGVLLFAVLRRKAQLDAVFDPLGFTGDVYQTFFRQYHGALQGRRVDVYFFRGPVLQIEVETSLATRLGVTRREHADTRFLGNLTNHTPLALEDSALTELMVYAPDEAWARRVLAGQGALGALMRLTALDGMFSRQQVLLRPGTWQLLCSGSRRLFGIELATEQVGRWLDDMLALTRSAEGQPAPQITDELTSLETFVQGSRQKTKYLALWAALGTIGFFAIVSIVVAVIVIAMRGGS